MGNKRLAGSSFALAQNKGGAGKSSLLMNLASFASDEDDYLVVMVDLDGGAPISSLVIPHVDPREEYTVYDALESVRDGGTVEDMLHHAPILGENVWFMCGHYESFLETEEGRDLVEYLPQLIDELKNTYIEDRKVDVVFLDTPGEEYVTKRVLQGVDHVAMPFALTGTDLSMTVSTMRMIVAVRNERGGVPEFIGGVPFNVSPRSSAAKKIVDGGVEFLNVLKKGDKILPYIPFSETMKNTCSKISSDGKGTVLFNARSTDAILLQTRKLWNALQNDEVNNKVFAFELERFVGIVEDERGA